MLDYTNILLYKNFIYIYFIQLVRKARIIRVIATENRIIPETRRPLSPPLPSPAAPVKVRAMAGIRQRKPRVALIMVKRPDQPPLPPRSFLISFGVGWSSLYSTIVCVGSEEW